MASAVFVFPRIHPLTRENSSLRGKNQFNGFFTTFQVNRFLSFSFAFQFSSRGKIYSRHDPFTTLSVSSSIETTALEQSLVNFSCSGSSANFCSCSRSKFLCTSASVWQIGLAVGNSVGKTIDSKSSFAAGFPAPRESLVNSPLKFATAP